MYAVAGIVIALAAAVFAFSRAARGGGVYATDLYHMTARTHRRFGIVSIVFAALAALSLALRAIEIPVLAIYTLVLILYGSSFVRGFSGEDE